nr:hypothetical protein [Tanacetum cinerariifolium]
MCEGALKIEDTLTGLEVIQSEENQIRLSLRTYIPETDLLEKNYELAIELLDGTLELGNVVAFSQFERKLSMGWYSSFECSRRAIALLKAIMLSSHLKLTFDDGVSCCDDVDSEAI